MKRCRKCQQELPLESFGKERRSTDGRTSRCKACLNEDGRKHYHADIELSRAQKRLNSARNKESRTQWANAHRERRRANMRAWKARNREHVRAANRASDARRVEQRRAYRERNADKIRVRKIRDKQRRIDRLRVNGGAHTQTEWRALCAKYNHRCLCCGKATELTPDHIVPIAQGGSDSITNIQPLCLSCNMEKGNREIDYRPKERAS
jgi:5-methylcytosine-specific restriction endonuclease McrA